MLDKKAYQNMSLVCAHTHSDVWLFITSVFVHGYQITQSRPKKTRRELTADADVFLCASNFHEFCE